jgi:hypothetical protein
MPTRQALFETFFVGPENGCAKLLRMRLTKAQRDPFRKAGKRGGKARAANMTPEARIESARMAAKARWEKAKATA